MQELIEKRLDILTESYNKNFKNYNTPIFESTQDEMSHYQHEQYDWLRNEERVKFVYNITEDVTVVFSEGDAILLSNKLFEGEYGSSWDEELLKFVYGPIEHVVHLISDTFSGDVEDALLGFAAIVETFALVSSFFGTVNPKVKVVSIIAGVLAALLFIIGGGIQLYDGIKATSNIKAGEFDANEFEAKWKEVGNELTNGSVHVFMGCVSLLIAYLMTGRTAAMREKLAKDLKYKVYSDEYTSIFKQAFKEWSHTVPHLGEHYLGGALALFIPASMFDNDDEKNVKIIKNIDKEAKKNIDEFKKSSAGLTSSIKEMDFTKIGKVDNLGDFAIEVLKRTTIGKVTGVAYNIIKNDLADSINDISDWVVEKANWFINEIQDIIDFFNRMYVMMVKYHKLYKKNGVKRVDVISMMQNMERKPLKSYKGKKIELNYKSPTGDKRAEEFMNHQGPSSGMTTMSKSSTKVNRPYVSENQQVVKDFDEFLNENKIMKQNENINVEYINVEDKKEQYFKTFEGYVEMEKEKEQEVNEGFMASVVDFSSEALKKLNFYFNGFLLDYSDAMISPFKKESAIKGLKKVLRDFKGEVSSQEYKAMEKSINDILIPKIESGDLKTSKDVQRAIEDSLDIKIK